MEERKPSGKVGSLSSMFIRVIGNLKGRVKKQYTGIELELLLGEICRVMCIRIDEENQFSLN